MEKFAFCVMCRDGVQLNCSTSRVEVCSVCHGSTVVTPDNICYCGKSCLVEKEGHAYCGNEECFKGLVRDVNWKPWSGVSGFAPGRHHPWPQGEDF